MSETNLSQYLLLFRESDDAPDVAPEEMQAMFATWFAWSERLVTVGKYVGGNPLTEGAESMEDACKIAGECPGLSRGMSVEVRPIMEH